MKPILATILVLTILSACGGPRQNRASPSVTQISSGPIASACMGSGRSAASRQLCGCIQTAVDKSLSRSDQRRGASFFGNPERAHAVRISDTTENDAFWSRWNAFSEDARKMCS